ncbi:hypothetical protein LOTGIDRAFT_108548 [Lottia gigantea]|uniref:Protein kinase domain-containing protein n=1 Tax=Lottia gigantea TaxID=225164 RepID=V3ZNG4_LOTGI|nr:hypothetical protein LOTGIDRAFT_108548 [Lottia gigantea]ESO84015.1 hypothetical protein LOTGIDRAFT_108548 [Lottia gigantea]
MEPEIGEPKKGENRECSDPVTVLYQKQVKKHRPRQPKKQQLQQLVLLFAEKGYRLGQEIGNGSYSRVRIVKKISDGEMYAAKIIKRKNTSSFLSNELTAAIKLDHPNIIKYSEIIILPHATILIMENAALGDLLSYTKDHGAFPNQEAKVMFRQITSAVQYLHQQGFVHRDLKLENILVRGDSSLVLSDFGFTRKVETSGETVSKTFCGSAAYASPEVLQGIPYDPKQNDVWSLGCILYILVCGKMPFDETDLLAMIKKQLMHQIAVPLDDLIVVHQQCQNLIRSLLHPDPQTRPTLDAVLDSNWLCSGTGGDHVTSKTGTQSHAISLLS